LKSTLIFNFTGRRIHEVHVRELRMAMIVCHCRGVTDRQIKRLVREGAGSAREIAQATGAGMRCGGCRSNVKQVVARTVERDYEKGGATSFIDLAVPVEG